MSYLLMRPSLRPSLILTSASVKQFRNTPVFQIQKTSARNERVNPFSAAGMLKHYEILPLVVIIGGGLIAFSGYLVCFCKTRNDLQFSKPPAYDQMNLHDPPVLKLVKTREYTQYKPLVELDTLYKEMQEAEEEEQQKKKKK